MRDISDNAEKEWTHAGYRCAVLDMKGHRCGYVNVPDEEKDEIAWTSSVIHGEFVPADVDAFGGITYGPDGDGWVGFDNAHSHDVRTKENNPNDELEAMVKETERLAESINIARKTDE